MVRFSSDLNLDSAISHSAKMTESWLRQSYDSGDGLSVPLSNSFLQWSVSSERSSSYLRESENETEKACDIRYYSDSGGIGGKPNALLIVDKMMIRRCARRVVQSTQLDASLQICPDQRPWFVFIASFFLISMSITEFQSR